MKIFVLSIVIIFQITSSDCKIFTKCEVAQQLSWHGFDDISSCEY